MQDIKETLKRGKEFACALGSVTLNESEFLVLCNLITHQQAEIKVLQANLKFARKEIERQSIEIKSLRKMETKNNGLKRTTIKDNLIKAEEYFFEKLHREIDDDEEE